MKKLVVFLVSSMVVLAAQAQPDVRKERMLDGMELAAKAQQCYFKIGEEALNEIGHKAQAVEAELKKLCKADKRDQAMDEAIEFGIAMSKDEAFQAAKKCHKIMAYPGEPDPSYPTSVEDFNGGHICDNF